MPTYSYACTACEHRFDTVQTFTDASLTDCPECAGRLRKLFSSVGIVFKGSGFYRTDSRAAPSTESGSSDKPQNGDRESTAEKSSSEQSNSEKPSSTSNSKSGSTGDSSGGSSGGSASSSTNSRTASTATS